VRTSLPKKALDDAATVGSYKSLARVERAFRSLKTVDIHLRPIFHWSAPRVRAHVLLCMLAYHVEYHMRARLAPMLYDETDQEQTAAMRASIVAKAERSEVARRKQTTCLTEDGPPVHSLQSLSPISQPMPGSRRPPRSTKSTSSPSVPGPQSSSSAPSNSSPSTRIVPSNATHALSKQPRDQTLIDAKRVRGVAASFAGSTVTHAPTSPGLSILPSLRGSCPETNTRFPARVDCTKLAIGCDIGGNSSPSASIDPTA
jgi:hypothetical protein